MLFFIHFYQHEKVDQRCIQNMQETEARLQPSLPSVPFQCVYFALSELIGYSFPRNAILSFIPISLKYLVQLTYNLLAW